MLFDDVTENVLLRQPIKKDGTLTTANHMLQNCQEDIQFCYDIRGKSYNKYDPGYADPRR